MRDAFDRRIEYLRVSVTDRCDLRCSYCMNDETSFVSRQEILTLEEIARLCDVFIALGVRKIRVTGGEPLVRRNVLSLIGALGKRIGAGLDEVALTTNGMRLAEFASALAQAGVRRVNVSLDTLKPDVYRAITKQGDLSQVFEGIAAARSAGLRVKLNCVLMKGVNEDEISSLLTWAHANGCDLTLIETMPMGDARSDRYLPADIVLDRLASVFHLRGSTERTGGPARYFDVLETGGRLGTITPLSQHFCDSCNRVRLTSTGKLLLCLGAEEGVELKPLLRSAVADEAIAEAIVNAMVLKPQGHDFTVGGTLSHGAGAIRAMSATGG